MSSRLFAKLNLKDQREILVLDPPPCVEGELAHLQGIEVRRDLRSRRPISFALAFVTRQSEVDRLAKSLASLAEGDAIVWFGYPKGSSKRLTTDISRDTGWRAMGAAGFEPVRLVAIDDDWSAIRFRRVEFIKTLKRDPRRAMTREGRSRAGK